MSTQDIIALISKIKEKVNKLIVLEMSKQGLEGIVTSHGDIIYSLFNKSKMTMAEIAVKIGKDKSTVTALVDKLIKLGYLTKDRDSTDARVVYVTLTQKGHDLKPLFEQISEKVLGIFYLNVSEKEKVALIKILEKIYNNM